MTNVHDQVHCITFVPGSHRLVIGTDRGHILVEQSSKNRSDEQISMRGWAAHEDRIYKIAFRNASDTTDFVSVDRQGSIRRWQSMPSLPLRVLALERHGIANLDADSELDVVLTRDVDAIPNSNELLVTHLLGLHCWSLGSGEMQARWARNVLGWTAGAVSADGKIAAARRCDDHSSSEVRVWSSRGNELQASWIVVDHPREQIDGLSFSPTGRYLSVVVPRSVDHDGLRIYDLELGQRAAGPTLDCDRAEFSPTDEIIAFEDDDRIGLWDVSKQQRIATLPRHPGTVTDIAFSRDGRHLASCGKDNVIRIWDLGEHAGLRQELVGHHAEIRMVHFTVDGDYLISTSIDGRIRFWQVHSGQMVLELDEFANQINNACVSEDDSHLALIDADGSIRILDLRDSVALQH